MKSFQLYHYCAFPAVARTSLSSTISRLDRSWQLYPMRGLVMTRRPTVFNGRVKSAYLQCDMLPRVIYVVVSR